jgi:hypothetical protein
VPASSPDRIGEGVLAHDRIEERGDEVILVGDVVVERHRLDAEVSADSPHREGFDPVLVGECHAAAITRSRSGAATALGLGGWHEVLA